MPYAERMAQSLSRIMYRTFVLILSALASSQASNGAFVLELANKNAGGYEKNVAKSDGIRMIDINKVSF